MEYAVQLLLPIIMGLALGRWLENTFQLSPLWTVGLAILGMVAGLGLMYKRLTYPELYKNERTMQGGLFLSPFTHTKSSEKEDPSSDPSDKPQS